MLLAAEAAATHLESGPFFLSITWVLPLLSFLAFWAILVFAKRIGRESAGFIAIGVIGVQFVLASGAALQWIARKSVHAAEAGTEAEALGRSASGAGRFAARMAEEGGGALREPVGHALTWYSNGPIDIKVGTHIDGFAVAMLFVVAFISATVHVFSREYLRDDERFTHYFAALALFTGAMFWMVQSATTLGLLFGWEVMGLCSYLLIGHWWEDTDNAAAALKAFVTTRTGDIGLLIGIVITFFAAGQTFDMAAINDAALNGEGSHLLWLTAAVCLFAGVVGKSAQFPLHTWLPDAMAGPTPASALIHAATMVVAGVYLVARLYGVFWAGFSIEMGGMNLGAWVGSITLVMAALLAFVQTDIKKVLAYSTVSQLGYMVMGLSVGAWTGAIFHLFTHAFFKALLFQAAGSVAHSGSHHSFDMERMGGLRKHMPRTWATFLVGFLALAGVFPLSGFWSKDEILLGAWKNSFGLALTAGLVGSFMTACYMTRAYWKTFEGENRLHLFHDEHDSHAPAAAHDEHAPSVAHDAHDAHGANDGPHESPLWITGPLIALAVMAALVGFLQWPGRIWFGHWTENLVIEETILKAGFEHPFNTGLAIIATVCGIGGLAVGYLYNKVFDGDLGLVRRFAPARIAHTTLRNKYYLDHLWSGVVIGFIRGPLARAAYWFNQQGLDGIVNGAGHSATAAGRWVYRYVDQGLVDNAANGAGSTVTGLGGALRTLQTGKVQNYAAIFVGAVGLIALALVLFV